MMRLFLAASLAFAAALASPAAAQENSLDCMESAYTKDQKATLQSIYEKFNFADDGGNATGDQLADIVGDATRSCATQFAWTQEQGSFALMYELGRQNELSMRVNGPFSPEELARIDAALATGDRTRLWQAVEGLVLSGMVGSDIEPDAADSMTMGMFIISLGLERVEERAEAFGSFLAMMALQRYGQREFAALQ